MTEFEGVPADLAWGETWPALPEFRELARHHRIAVVLLRRGA